MGNQCCKRKAKGHKLSDFVTSCGKTLDEVEIITGLSAHDRKLIREAGEVIFDKMHLENKGVAFLIEFFKVHPSHQHYFKAFRDVPLDELWTLPHMGNHGRRVMEQMAALVKHVDKPNDIKAQLATLSGRHRPRSVGPSQFKDMLTMFLVYVKSQLGTNFTSQHESAWTKLLTYCMQVLEELAAQHSGQLANGDAPGLQGGGNGVDDENDNIVDVCPPDIEGGGEINDDGAGDGGDANDDGGSGDGGDAGDAGDGAEVETVTDAQADAAEAETADAPDADAPEPDGSGDVS